MSREHDERLPATTVAQEWWVQELISVRAPPDRESSTTDLGADVLKAGWAHE